MRKQCLSDLRALQAAYAAACASPSPLWKARARRSACGWALSSDILQAAKEVPDGADVSCELQAYIRRLHSHCGSSCRIEDGFRFITRRLDARQNGEKMHSSDVWHCLVESPVLKDLYNFTAVDGRQAKEQRGELPLPESFYHVKKLQASTMLPKQKLPGYGPPTWPTLSPPFLHLSEDIGPMVYLHKARQMDHISRAWRSEFLQEGLVCMHKGNPTPYLSFGGSLCCCLWPLQRVEWERLTTFKLQALPNKRGLEWRPVLDFQDWVVVPTQPVSPAGLRAEVKASLATTEACMSITGELVQRGPAMPLLKYAASQAFFNLSSEKLLKLCQDCANALFQS